MSEKQFSFSLELLSLGAEAFEYHHKDGTIQARCRMQVVRGKGDAPSETPDSPKIVFYANRAFLKELGAGAKYKAVFTQLSAPKKPVTDTEEKRAKAIYKEIKAFEKRQEEVKKEYIGAKKDLDKMEAAAEKAGGINNLPIKADPGKPATPSQEGLRALRNNAGYISTTINKQAKQRKDLDFRLPDAYQGKTEKEAQAIKDGKKAVKEKVEKAEKRAKRPNKPKIS